MSKFSKTYLILSLSVIQIALCAMDGWIPDMNIKPLETTKTYFHEGFELETIPVNSPVKSRYNKNKQFTKSNLGKLKIEFHDGAKGKVEYSKSTAYTGKMSLKITKSNFLGYIVVKAPSIKIDRPMELQARANYSCQNGSPSYALGYLLLLKENNSLRMYHPKGGNRATKMLYLSNTDSGKWGVKLGYQKVKAKNGETITPAIIVAGSPSTSFWDEWVIENNAEVAQAWSHMQKNPPYPIDYDKQRMDEGKFDAMLAKDSEHTAKVVKQDGYARLTVDGKVIAPMLFKSWCHSIPDSTDHAGRIFDQSNVHLQVINLRLGDSRWRPGCWRSKDDFDKKWAIKVVKDAMRTAPNSYFIITMALDPYMDFCKDFPDEVWRDAHGRMVYGSHVHMDPRVRKAVPRKYWPWVSMYSKIWRDMTKKHIATIIDEFKNQGLSKRIVGFHIGGLHDMQFAMRARDNGKPAVAAFREYLKKRYNTVSNLQKAWGNNNVDFNNALPPKVYRKKGILLNPKTDRPEIDYYTFFKKTTNEIYDDFAKSIKTDIGKSVIVLRWLMSTYGGEIVSEHCLQDFIESKYLDGVVPQPSYRNRYPGLPLNSQIPIKSFHRNNKICIYEADIRTLNNIKYVVSMARAFSLSCMFNISQWESANHRLVGMMMARDIGLWYYDMGPGWFNSPDIQKDIKSAHKGFEEIVRAKVKKKVNANTLMIVDEEGLRLRNILRINFNYEIAHLISGQLGVLTSSGVPMDIMTLQDVLKTPEILKSYKVVILGAMFNIDDVRKSMIKSLQKQGASIIYLAGTGYLNDGYKTTGFKIKYKSGPASHQTVAEPNVNINMLSRLTISIMPQAIDSHPKSNYFRPGIYSIMPDKNLKVYARYTLDNSIAIAEIKKGKSRNIYIAPEAGLTPEFFRSISDDAGAFAISDKVGLQVEMNDRFMMVHGIIPNEYKITIPFKSDIINMKNGKTVYKNVKSFKLNVKAGETLWLRLVQK